MYLVTKRIEFCYGHRLLDYDCVCKHPHGHNASVEIDVRTDSLDNRNMDDARYLQAFCARYGLLYSRPGNGISHYVHLERYAKPGEVLVSSNSSFVLLCFSLMMSRPP